MTYFDEDSFKKVLKDFNELKLLEINVIADARVGRESQKSLNVLVEKEYFVY